MTLPSFSKFGLGVRSEEKNSDNIIAEKYDARLHGQNTSLAELPIGRLVIRTCVK